MQKVKVLRSFNKTPQGGLAEVGETIEVEDTRASELVRSGLAEAVHSAVKRAPEPENKMAPQPDNKKAVVPETSAIPAKPTKHRARKAK
jgi:hypothetical protein